MSVCTCFGFLARYLSLALALIVFALLLVLSRENVTTRSVMTIDAQANCTATLLAVLQEESTGLDATVLDYLKNVTLAYVQPALPPTVGTTLAEMVISTPTLTAATVLSALLLVVSLVATCC